jgi:hypothetical protein
VITNIRHEVGIVTIALSNNTIFIIILVISLLLLAFGLWWFGKKCIFADEFNKT